METEVVNKFEFSDGPSVRSKTSNRMNYEAQVQVIRGQIGDLEEIRHKLQLSKRKICQLLLVDPSAWTRWQNSSDGAPPHIYRALQWYMVIKNEIPGLTPQYFLGNFFSRTDSSNKVAEARLSEFEIKIDDKVSGLQNALNENQNLKEKIHALEIQVRIHRVSFFMLVVAFFLLGGAGFFFLKRMATQGSL